MAAATSRFNSPAKGKSIGFIPAIVGATNNSPADYDKVVGSPVASVNALLSPSFPPPWFGI